MYIRGQRRMIRLHISPSERNLAAAFFINLPGPLAYRYRKYIFEKKMSAMWIKEKIKLILIRYINEIAKEYGDDLLDPAEILNVNGLTKNTYYKSKSRMQSFSLTYFKERQNKLFNELQEIVNLYPGIHYEFVNDNFDKLIARYYVPQLLEKKVEKNGDK